MSSLNYPKTFELNRNDVLQAIREAMIKQYPSLKDEEFEITFRADSYSNAHSAQARVIDVD